MVLYLKAYRHAYDSHMHWLPFIGILSHDTMHECVCFYTRAYIMCHEWSPSFLPWLYYNPRGQIVFSSSWTIIHHFCIVITMTYLFVMDGCTYPLRRPSPIIKASILTSVQVCMFLCTIISDVTFIYNYACYNHACP